MKTLIPDRRARTPGDLQRLTSYHLADWAMNGVDEDRRFSLLDSRMWSGRKDPCSGATACAYRPRRKKIDCRFRHLAREGIAKGAGGLLPS